MKCSATLAGLILEGVSVVLQLAVLLLQLGQGCARGQVMDSQKHKCNNPNNKPDTASTAATVAWPFSSHWHQYNNTLE